MIVVKNADLLAATENIVFHQVNCRGFIGGLAATLEKAYPTKFYAYFRACRLFKSHPEGLLGEVTLDFTDTTPFLIAHIYGQLNTGSGLQTNYEALGSGLVNLIHRANPTATFAAPFGIGCGLAGGDWKIVYAILEKVFSNRTLVLYKLN